MGGQCVGLGIDLDDDGKVELAGARQQAWPHESTCPIASNNGLRVDPITGLAWVAPDLVCSAAEAVSTPLNVHPTNDDVHALRTVTLTHTVGACTRTFMHATVGGGYAGIRVVSGNFWIVSRYATLFVDNIAVATTGTEIVASFENNGGGIGGAGHSTGTTPFTSTLNPGQVVKLETKYELALPQFTNHADNNLAFRPPRITAAFWTFP